MMESSFKRVISRCNFRNRFVITYMPFPVYITCICTQPGTSARLPSASNTALKGTGTGPSPVTLGKGDGCDYAKLTKNFNV